MEDWNDGKLDEQKNMKKLDINIPVFYYSNIKEQQILSQQ